MIKQIPIIPGVTLRCYPDRRFKQGCLSFQIVRKMDAAEAALNALIPAVLLREHWRPLKKGPEPGWQSCRRRSAGYTCGPLMEEISAAAPDAG